MPSPWLILAVVGAILASAFCGYEYGQSVQRTADQVAADTLKIEAAATLQAQTAKAMAAEEAAAGALSKNEKDTRNYEDALSAANARAVAAVAASGGLLDPGRRGDGCAAAADHAATQALNHASAAATAQLSDIATRFLLSESRRADEVVVRLQACESDDDEIRAAVSGGTQ